MVTVADFRAYLNPAPDITDAQLTGWLNAAKSEARTAGVPDFRHNAQYDLFIQSLASWYYDNRGLQVSGTYQVTALETKKRMTDSFVLQLRYAREDPEPEPSQEADPEPGTTSEGGDST